MIATSAIISDNPSITSPDNSSILTVHSPNKCQFSPMPINLNDDDKQSSPMALDTATERSVEKVFYV
jgi:hypothetical protein